ncbi:DedA family protein [Allorhizocola rhizosphaerae]|uniref:DedA family protein n=1 Tax=Allorhizocola rhizosphaerae TaxID=1872709 RepID=UPI000E3E4C08|nr:DedA family protein [Allorhizocola rhizosphaerae]
MRIADQVLGWLAALDPLHLAALTSLFTALETTALIGLFVPGDLAVLLAGSTASTPGRFAFVFAAAALGTYAGEMGGYALGRKVGPRIRYSRFGRLLGEHRWVRATAYLHGKGASVLVPARFVSVVHAVAPLVAGTVGMPFRRFAFWSGVGAVVWAVTYTTIGMLAGSAYREYGHLGLFTSVGLLAAGVVIMAVRSRRGNRDVTSATADGHATSSGSRS